MRDEHTYILIGILVLLVMFILIGCVSTKTHRRELKDERIMALQKARKIAYRQHCTDAVDFISGRIEAEEMKP